MTAELASALDRTIERIKVFMHSPDCQPEAYRMNTHVVGALEILEEELAGEPHWRALADERMGEIHRARAIIDRLTGQRERLYSALSKMVASESMVEAAHAKAGNPYFNAALNEAREVLEEIK